MRTRARWSDENEEKRTNYYLNRCYAAKKKSVQFCTRLFAFHEQKCNGGSGTSATVVAKSDFNGTISAWESTPIIWLVFSWESTFGVCLYVSTLLSPNADSIYVTMTFTISPFSYLDSSSSLSLTSTYFLSFPFPPCQMRSFAFFPPRKFTGNEKKPCLSFLMGFQEVHTHTHTRSERAKSAPIERKKADMQYLNHYVFL